MSDDKTLGTSIDIVGPVLENGSWPPSGEVVGLIKASAEAQVGVRDWSPPGLVGLNIRAFRGSSVTARNPGVVLKVYRHRSHSRRERWCFEHLSGVVAHVPALLASGERGGVYWAVVEARSELAAAEIWGELSLDEKVRLFRQIGETLRQIHDATATDRHGELELAWGRNYLTWSTLLTNLLDRFRTRMSLLDGHDTEVGLVLKAVDALYRELRMFHPRSQAHLVTRNLQLSNILVTYDRGVAEFSGLIDFHNALLAPGELDFGLLFWCDAVAGAEPMISAFYDGYVMARTMDVKRREAVYRKIAAVRVVDQSLTLNGDAPSTSEWERRILERSIHWLGVT